MITDAYVQTLYDRSQRDPVQGDYGKAWALDNPSGFRAYGLMSRYYPQHAVHHITDLYGKPRWLNDKGYKVMCMALGLIATGKHTSLSSMSEQIGCHRQTVSRWLRKLTAWGILIAGVVRGKYGGVVLFARRVGDNLDRWAVAARAKMAALRARKLNAHPPTQGMGTGSYSPTYYPSTYSMSKGAHLELRERLGLDPSRQKGVIRCPAHEDKRSSLSWKITQDDKLLLHCFAGCTFAEIRASVA